MADEKEKKTPKPQTAPDNVVHLSRCPVCNQKPVRAGFCEEHFHWFKFGLVDRKGVKPVDFDKKFQAFEKRFKKVS